MKHRKHESQMSPEERDEIETRVRQLSEDIGVSRHTRERLFQRGIVSIEECKQALRFGRVVEVSARGNDIRVLVRLNRKKKFSTIVVVSLTDGEVKTAWRNEREDEHPTLDWNLYSSGPILSPKIYTQM